LRDLARLRPWLPELCNLLQLWHVLFWAAFFHDWGKAARGFQTRLREKGRWPHRHEVLSLAFLGWLLPEDDARTVVATIVSHHRDPEDLERLYPLSLPPEDDPLGDLIQELDESTIRRLWHWLKEICPVWIEALGFLELGVKYYQPLPEEEAVAYIKSGAGVLRRRLLDYRRFVRSLRSGASPHLVVPGLVLRGSMLQADHTASAVTGMFPELGIARETVLASTNLSEATLYPHQRLSWQAESSAILTAPTGSGKTEAALLWASCQFEIAGGLPRLFYVLPYQASMNAMYDRLAQVFPGRVGLLHSRSILALYRRLMEREYGPHQAAEEARWLRNLAELRYYPVSVFSPYQMLKAVYRLKGYEALLTDYAGAAFIFDEIHAYEPARLALILETIRYLCENLQARFFVMSATLPHPVWQRLREVLKNPTEIVSSAEVFRVFTRHQINLVAGELLENGLERALTAFREGKSVLVTCNTVARAQEAFCQLRQFLPPEVILMVHGRYNGRDRLEKERKVMEATAVDSERRGPVVVVATQVVEVSLNIDLDVLFSDPAPLEALVQRFGRVNRKRRVTLAPVYVFTEPVGGQGVYFQDMVNNTLEVLRQEADGRPVDEALVQEWLKEIYSGDVLHRWEAEYDRVASEFRQTFLKSLRPFDSDATLEEAFERLFDGVEVLPAGLWEEYRGLRKERPLEASQLLVSISWGRWQQLRKAGLIRSREGEWPPVIDVPYSPELGLVFEGTPELE
jgi:CRISPR-associated endonuclease/helicase Cas3